MAVKNNELEMFTLDQIKDEFIGEIGTPKRILNGIPVHYYSFFYFNL
jgi:hypothetical protein